MHDFVDGQCKAVKEPEKFVNDWLVTDKNPCSVCGNDKSKCSFYEELVTKGAIAEKENQP